MLYLDQFLLSTFPMFHVSIHERAAYLLTYERSNHNCLQIALWRVESI